MALVGGIEAGGTKFVVGARREDTLIEQRIFPTRSPDETLADVGAYLRSITLREGPIAAMGVASFGPVDLDPASTTFGTIRGTPKPGWDGFDIFGAVAASSGAPVAIDTDVNAAALAEGQAGACRGLARHCYVTVGTGIGVGFIEDGRPARAIPHAEAGHIRVARAEGDSFAGVCLYHGDCLEGLAAGPAIERRWNTPGADLPAEHPAWQFESHYLAELCATLTYIFRPQRIVLAGGVMSTAGLLERVRSAFERKLAGYALGSFAAAYDTYLVGPELTEASPGLVGAFLMAENLLGRSPEAGHK